MEDMGWIGWLTNHWFALLQTGGVMGSLIFTGAALLLDARSRRAGNLIRLTDRHRELWERMYTRPHLARILDPNADIRRAPVTSEEELFVIFVILHLSDNYYVIKAGLFEKPKGLRKDIRMFFALPIPLEVWKKMRELQEERFVQFVEGSLSD
jgi:hypothetical protein